LKPAHTQTNTAPQPSIDIVYLWVDGQDSAWQAKRRAAAQALSTVDASHLAPYSNVEGRFRDNDELRFSLRALAKFFPAHGHIYIVTDAQTPAWFKPGKGLTIVDHRDIMPADCLPTFDSGNIESYIHRIAGLSERFFYLNDDVFFGAPVALNDWFFDTGVYVTWSDDAQIVGNAMQPESTALINASRLSQQWLSTQRFVPAYTHTPRTFAHSPRPMLKSIMVALERIAPELFTTVRSTVFRAWDKPTIVSDFVLRWALASAQAKVREHSHLHVSTGDADAPVQLAALSAQFGQLDFFCINDTLDDAPDLDPRLKQVREVLAVLLPVASPFESGLL
jgi:Stealth protein CR2, conserved region 2/Stealth protein CR1, conserved region 1